MPPLNTSRPSPITFLLMGIPGLEHLHVWIGIPFCSMYVVAVVGNVTILAVVKAERSLHEPMFFFLCMLSVTDLVLSTSTLPRMLCLFWLGAHDIAFDACLTQMFFIHSFTTMESGFFLAMAIDRYVAICHPLHHTTILTHARITIMGIIVVIRGVAFFSPHPILLRQLPYCRTRTIAHTYCEFMAVVKLACVDTGATTRYSLSVASIIGSCDAILTAVSYAFILRSVFRLPSREASFKALGTCGSHVCVILVFYSTAGFSIFTHRFGKNVPAHVHIFIANMYLLVPPFLNPIVYGVRTKKIQEHVLRALKVKVV
ncbi:olfactory receptor 52M1-like [Leopardus geoffroyi]|uniref:Olfactory receptor 52M1-like n=2 Tax=Felinae TaxID=338152 RepID=A0A667GJ62_LYNCA|nr:olfactory receptor 52M1-like [Puma concolor]XP_030189583.1 olfactory receptor 52M1-like [Lynx canadensis]XP_040345020.1 olfactory receptor 52M1-like [Puma yagouaroundi]XP_045338440.1 olfactory receptor 52M1-like [Leopardus geoffroyi]XP_058546462.1 olfactory receptor 52M1-like [Neofelis nebulosa]